MTWHSFKSGFFNCFFRWLVFWNFPGIKYTLMKYVRCAFPEGILLRYKFTSVILWRFFCSAPTVGTVRGLIQKAARFFFESLRVGTWNLIPSPKRTASLHLKIGRNPNGKEIHLPTIIFQGRTVSFFGGVLVKSRDLRTSSRGPFCRFKTFFLGVIHKIHHWWMDEWIHVSNL